MKRTNYSGLGLTLRVVLGVIVLVGAVALVATQATSQDKPAKAGQGMQPSPEEMQQMMNVWQEMATPGEAHKALEPFVGSWDLVVKSWMGGPDTEPNESKATSRSKWILDGHYVLEETQGTFTMPNPVTGKEDKYTFKGHGLTGYDNFKKVYTSVWADNMSTQLMSTKGVRNPANGVFTFYGEMDDPTMGLQDHMVKTVLRILSKDKHVMEMYNLAVADDYKVMEITYTRAK